MTARDPGAPSGETHRHPRCLTALVLAALVSSLGCSGSSGDTGGQGTGEPGGAPSTPADPPGQEPDPDPSGCSATVTPAETFDASGAPKLDATLQLSTPWNYDKPENAARSYPLLLKLPGGDGCDGKAHPAFVKVYETDVADGEALKAFLDEAVKTYRIDRNRIYAAGFSVGGSGSYRVAKGFHEDGGLFAGIFRMAGQSDFTLPEDVLEKTSVWYHIGTGDTSVRVQGASEAYAYAKGLASNATAVEASRADTLGGFPRTTKTLTKDGVQVFALSVYDGMGHTSTPATDPAVWDWLFSQSLECR